MKRAGFLFIIMYDIDPQTQILDLSEKNPFEFDWFHFHFGSGKTMSEQFRPESLYGHHDDCYVLVTDLCSFTSLCRATEDYNVIGPLMTNYYTRVRNAIHRYHGMLDKIMGDGVIAVWGVHSREEGMLSNCINSARELMHIAMETVERWQSLVDIQVEPLGMRLGLSKGNLFAIPRDTTYPGLTLIGNPLNLSSRLQNLAEPNRLVCSNRVFQEIPPEHELEFRPCKGPMNEKFIDVKNYGPVKAWMAPIHPLKPKKQ